MALIDDLRQMALPAPIKARTYVPSEKRELSIVDDALLARFGRVPGAPARSYRLPTVREALGVPAIHRAVALISSTTGMLSVQGYRNGALMSEVPRLITRPDPDSTPYAFYGGSAANMAKYGEIVWWIASVDTDGLASALVNVPLRELQVQDNPDDRRRPRYQWGTIVSTRWSPADQRGRFVHIKYPLGEPFDLRGEGPLQHCNAAVSVSVESQAWAAQFYADGGSPSVVIKHAGELSPEPDADGLNEADRLRAQFVEKPHNVPRVIDQNIESIDYKQPNEAGAQMLEARQFNNGDAAREFGIPGSLLEYQSAGSSLTYQNLEGEFTKLVKVCLAPLYLEPMEQALSDLLSRSTVARFNVKGFQRPDAKARWEIYQIMVAVLGPQRAAEIAAIEEGIDPGDVEYAPVPFSPPAAVPVNIPHYASRSGEIRCTGQHVKRQNGVARLATCGRLLSTTGAFTGQCPRCKKVYADSAADAGPSDLAAAILALANREQAPVTVTISEGAIQVHNQPAPVVVNVPEAPEAAARATLTRLTYDDDGRISGIIEGEAS